MKPSGRFLADQLLAVLHSHPGRVSTTVLTDLAPPLIEAIHGCDPAWHEHPRSSRTVEETCWGDHHVHVRYRFPREIYVALRDLAGAGDVHRWDTRGSSEVYWSAARPARFLDELEACWELPPARPAHDLTFGAD